MLDVVILITITLFSLFLIIYGIWSYRRKWIAIPIGGPLGRGSISSGRWSIPPSIFMIFAGLFSPILALFYWAGRFLGFGDLGAVIGIAVWTFSTVGSIFYFMYKKENRKK